MRLRILPVACLCAGFALPCAAGASTGPAGTFAAVRAEKPPALDAALTDPAWAGALVATGLQTAPTHQRSRFPARFMLLYDDTNLYVGMHLEQSGVPLTATQ